MGAHALDAGDIDVRYCWEQSEESRVLYCDIERGAIEYGDGEPGCRIGMYTKCGVCIPASWDKVHLSVTSVYNLLASITRKELGRCCMAWSGRRCFGRDPVQSRLYGYSLS